VDRGKRKYEKIELSPHTRWRNFILSKSSVSLSILIFSSFTLIFTSNCSRQNQEQKESQLTSINTSRRALAIKSIENAVYDDKLFVPRCPQDVEGCSSGNLLDGSDNSSTTPEPNQPNTLPNSDQSGNSQCPDKAGIGSDADVRIMSIQIETLSETGFIQPSKNIEVVVRAWCNSNNQWIDIFYTDNADANAPIFEYIGSARCGCGGGVDGCGGGACKGFSAPVSRYCSSSGNETVVDFVMTLPSISADQIPRKMAIRARIQSSGAEQNIACYTLSSIYDHDDLVFFAQNPPPSFTCGVYDSSFKAPVCYGDGWCGTCNTVVCRDNVGDLAESPPGFFQCSNGGNEPNQPNTLFSQCQDTGENEKNSLDEQIRRINIKSLAPSGKFEGGQLVEISILAVCDVNRDQIILAYGSGVTYFPSQITNWRYISTVRCPTPKGKRLISGAYWNNLSYTLRLDNVEGWHAVRVIVFRCSGCDTITGDICPVNPTNPDAPLYRDADDFVFYVKAVPPSSLPICATFDNTSGDGDPIYNTPKCPAGASVCSTCNLVISRDNISGTSEPNQPNTLSSAPNCPDDSGKLAYLRTESIERIEIRSLSDSGTFDPGKDVEVSVLVYCDPVFPRYLQNYLTLLYSSNADTPSFAGILTATCSAPGYQIFRAVLTLGNIVGRHVLRAIFQQGAFSSNEICAGGGSGQDGDTDDLVFIVGVPKAPPNFKVEGVAPDTITLSWSDVLNETYYEIRWTDTFTPDFSKWNPHSASPLSPDTTWYADRHLSEGTFRCYAIRACNENGCSSFVWDCATIPSLSANCAVFDPVWRVPRCDGGVNNCSTCDLVVSRDSLPRRQEINTPNAWYSSSCPDGAGGDWYLSRSIEKITLTTDAPSFSIGYPISVTVRVFCSSTADYVHLYVSAGTSPISWSRVGSQACSGSNQVEDKTFSFTPSADDWYVIRAVVTGSRTSTCPGGLQDEVDDIAVRVGGVPAVPSGFDVIFVPPDIARVVWSDILNETYYQLVSAPSPLDKFTDDTPHSPLGANTTQHDHAGLQSGQTLCFKLRACNSDGCSAFTSVKCVTTAPNPPYNLSVTAYSTETMGSFSQYVVSFQDNSGNEDGFVIERTSDGSSWTRLEWWSDSSTKAGTGSRKIEFSLQAESRLCFRVASFKQNAGGTLTISQWADGTTKCVIGVRAPSNLYGESAPMMRTLKFLWNDNSSYEVGQNFEWRLKDLSGYVKDAVSGKEYYEKEFPEEKIYCARITNWWNGDSLKTEEQGSYSVGYSSEICFIAFGSPSPLIAEIISESAVKLTWQDSSTTESGFRIEVNSGSGWRFLALSSPNSITYLHSGLVAGTYCYRVRAESSSGFSSWSNVSCVKVGALSCSTIWNVDLSGGVGGSVTTSAVIDDGNIYVGTSTGYLISVDIMSGQIRWLKNLGSAVSSHLCAIQGWQRIIIFVGTVDGKFHAVDSEGNLIGTRDLGGVMGGCAVKDDKVYLGTSTGWVFVLSKSLKILKAQRISGAITAAPAIDAIKGALYFATESGKAYSFTLELEQNWVVNIGTAVRSSPGLGPKGDIYFGADDGKLYKVSPSGSVVWSYNIGSAIRSSPVVYTYGAQVTVVVGAENGSVYAIKEDITGTTPSLLWSYSTGGVVKSSGALSQKSVFVGSSSTLYSISVGGGSSICSTGVLGEIESPVKMKGQIVFVGTKSGRLYAISSAEPQSLYSWVDFGNDNGRVLDAHPYRGFAVEKSSWPVSLGTGIGAEIWVSPKLYDFDRNGKLEIVIATRGGQVYVLNSEGTVKAGWPKSTGNAIFGSPAIGDIDGDGSDEIVVANDGGLVYAFDSAGNVKPGFPISVTCRIRFLTLANIDSDPENEILFPNFESCNRLYVYDGKDSNGDGVADLKWYYQLSQRIRSHPVVTTVSGQVQILIADVVGNVYKFDSSGNLISGWPINVGLSQWMSSPSVGDIDGNGVQDFVVGGGGTGPNKIYAYDLDGNSKWSLVLQDENGNNLSGYYPRNIVLANIDGDSGLEVIVTVLPFNFGDPGYIYVIDDNGVMIWFKKFSSQPSLAPAVGDFDYDGSQEIVFTTDGGWLHIFDALSGEYEYGSPYFLGSRLRGPSPVFGDIDGNGRLELVFGDLSGYVRVFELGKQTIKGRMEWYFRKNGRNNANYNENE